MNKLIFISCLTLLTQISFAQTRVDSLVQSGIAHHDKGEFTTAIDLYNKALELEPNSSMVHYEIALSYMELKEYEKSISYADKVIAMNDKHLVPAYVVKGSGLDYLGKTNESIALFENAIKQHGPNYLLYYNLGLDYYKLENDEKAEEALRNAIQARSDHPSSHLLLAHLMADKNQKVQSLLGLHYFLYLEPRSQRSKEAYELLRRLFGGNVKTDENKPNTVNIYVDANQTGGDFGAADMMISLLAASKTLDENKGKTEDELFIENTTAFFKILGELKKKKNKGLWWEFYIPFFYDLAKSEHIDTYCYYISQSANLNARDWIAKNKSELEKFDKWLKGK